MRPKSQARALSGVFYILRCIGLALAVFCLPDKLYAQFTDPRTYDNTPVSVNQLELVYAYARANASIDTSLIVRGAVADLLKPA